MKIVLNEKEWAEQLLRDRELGKKPYETLCCVAKYYKNEGYSKSEIRKLLEGFLLKCDPPASVVAWSGTLDNAVKCSAKYPLIMINHICVSRPEMEIIDSLPGRQLRRLAFTLLCIAKYRYAVAPQTNYWVGTPDNEILKMANINTSIKRQSAMFGQLKDLGMIRFSKQVDNLSVQVLFVKDGDTAAEITDFRNLGYQYMKIHGEPYFECCNCGITTKVNKPGVGRPQKYCSDCAAKIKIQQSVNSVMGNLNKNKQQKNNQDSPTA